MAEGDSFGFLTRKIGPLPVWMYGVIIVGAYYWYTHYGPGASSSTAGNAQGIQVDTSANLPSQPQFGASQYSNNSEWEGAAINYLVGESVPPDQASAAVWNYLHSKVLTTVEQKDVNLAIEGIGPPPNIPAPATVTSGPGGNGGGSGSGSGGSGGGSGGGNGGGSGGGSGGHRHRHRRHRVNPGGPDHRPKPRRRVTVNPGGPMIGVTEPGRRQPSRNRRKTTGRR